MGIYDSPYDEMFRGLSSGSDYDALLDGGDYADLLYEQYRDTMREINSPELSQDSMRRSRNYGRRELY